MRHLVLLLLLSVVYGDHCQGKSNAWVTDLAPLPEGSGECAGAMIGDMMYFAGEANTDTYAYNFTTMKWRTVAKRIHPGNHHAAIVHNNEWWLIGGIDAEAYGTVQVYNPQKDTWTAKKSLPWDGGSVCAALIDEVIYVCGGIVGFEHGKRKGGTNTTNVCAKYDLNSKDEEWISFKSMPEGRNHAAVTTDGKKMWVFGGRMGKNVPQNGFPNVQVYDPSTDSWTQHPKPMPVGRGGTGHAVYSSKHDRFYVFGGETQNDPRATSNWVYNRTDIYDPQTNSWSSGAVMPFARHGIFPILRDNEIHIVAGGWHHGYAVSTNYQKYCI